MRDGQDVVIEAGRNVRGAFDFKFDPSTDFASFEAAASAKPFDQAIHDALDQRKVCPFFFFLGYPNIVELTSVCSSPKRTSSVSPTSNHGVYRAERFA